MEKIITDEMVDRAIGRVIGPVARLAVKLRWLLIKMRMEEQAR